MLISVLGNYLPFCFNRLIHFTHHIMNSKAGKTGKNNAHANVQKDSDKSEVQLLRTFILRQIRIKIKLKYKIQMGRSIFKGEVLTQGEQAALQTMGGRESLGGDEPGHSVMYKKKRKKKEETEAVSYYKPHPHLKCPHMQSVLLLSFPFSGYFQEVFDHFSFLFALTTITISFCLNATSFSAVLKKVNKKSFKNKMQQPHFIFYYYIYSIYI